MTIRSKVTAALKTEPAGWRKELALKLAGSLDKTPNASMAKELRALMDEIGEGAAPKERSKADELRAKRAERDARAASG